MSTTDTSWFAAQSPPAEYSSILGETPRTILGPCLELTLPDSGASITDARLDSLRDAITRELNLLGQYPRGWDGYDGVEFDPDLIDTVARTAEGVVRQLRSATSIPSDFETGPASDGSIDIECAYRKRSMLLTFYPREARLELSLSDESDEWESQERVEGFRLASWIAWLLGERRPPRPLDDATRRPR